MKRASGSPSSRSPCCARRGRLVARACPAADRRSSPRAASGSRGATSSRRAPRARPSRRRSRAERSRRDAGAVSRTRRHLPAASPSPPARCEAPHKKSQTKHPRRREREVEAMSPLKKSNNIAARMGRWSASHWKTAVFGWLAFVVAAVVDRHGRRPEEHRPERRERRPVPPRRPHPARRRLPGRPADRDRPDPEQEAHRERPGLPRDDRRRRRRGRSRSRTIKNLPLAARPGARRPDLGRRAHRDGRVRHEGRRRRSRRRTSTRSLAATDKVAAAHPGFYVGEAGSISSGKALDKMFNEQLAQAGERSIPLTLIVLLLVFGAVVAAGVPLLLALSAVIGHDRPRRAAEPHRPDGPERQRRAPARRPGRRRRLLALLLEARA